MESGTEHESENDSKVRSVRACPVIDLFASRIDTEGKIAKMKNPSYPTVQRTEVQAIVKRKRGRPKKEVSRRFLPMLNKPSHSLNNLTLLTNDTKGIKSWWVKFS